MNLIEMPKCQNALQHVLCCYKFLNIQRHKVTVVWNKKAHKPYNRLQAVLILLGFAFYVLDIKVR